ncbi:MAG: hypothetical protein AB8B83_00755 [Bdellovibrionales bacterium]
MDMANQFLSLSLFIMLLSFFIILNSLSSYEDVKSRPVLNSIASTFSRDTPEQLLQPNTIESVQESNNEGDTLDQLQDLFNAHITGAEISINRLGTIMYVRMPLEEFEKSLLAPSREPRPGQKLGDPGTFMPTLLSLMQTRESKVPYRMDMLINIAENPSEAIVNAPEETFNVMSKIANVTKRLEDSGLEKKLLSGGLVRGDVGSIDITFTRYIPVNPLQEGGR